MIWVESQGKALCILPRERKQNLSGLSILYRLILLQTFVMPGPGKTLLIRSFHSFQACWDTSWEGTGNPSYDRAHDKKSS